jgi:CPA2 family monovalent cation:H+ antiporter-2
VDGHLFNFALLLGVLGVAAVISLSLRLPVVPLYILAGVTLGIWLVEDEVVSFLGHLGVVFLLFAMGLEFSVGSTERSLRRFVGAGTVNFALNFPVGLLVGLALGWSWVESLFLAGIVYMTSSAVVSKCIVDFGRAARPETETVLGVLVFEDLVIAFYMVLLTSLLGAGPGEAASPLSIGFSLLRSGVFVGLLLVLARRFQRPLERVFAGQSDEGFTLVLFSFVMLVASAALASGLSAEVGAFLAGLVVGSTDLKERSARILWPFQTLFAALFFVSFGMSIDLGNVAGVLVPTALLVALGLTSKTLGGYLAGRIAGHGPPQSFVVGLSLIPKGEFSIVLATLAAASAPAGHPIVALSALYVLALAIIGPLLMREADRIRARLPLARLARPRSQGR